MAICIVAADGDRIEYRGVSYEGVRCSDGGDVAGKHMLFVVPVPDEDLTAIREADWVGITPRSPRRGRKRCNGWYVSKSPSCVWPGTRLQPATDGRDERAQPRCLTEAEYNQLVVLGATVPPFEPPPPPREGARNFTAPTQGPDRKACDRLEPIHRMFLAAEIVRFAAVARDPDHAMRTIARKLISWLLWRWTADGFSRRSNAVIHDGRKYAFHLLPHTEAAWRQWDQQGRKKKRGDGLTHEHTVMREVLVRHIVHAGLSAEEVVSLLARQCQAAIVDRESDARLRALDKGWSKKPCPLCAPNADPWTRYRADALTWNQLVQRDADGSTVRLADRVSPP